ncbi:CoA transferase [Streptomyces sp. 3MP-14]|uniref:CoA transferase n=1 Tax=Streptomyces mimosae TaxID=2586635 RepID=A0A5N6AC46_9ACTN|nr:MULTISPECIES: CoA transferase [Streptomyces]KAB8165825.1 CoA transferase [Streptomyces mimosae]KAB8176214.1 CoA transferase [Streptomyces sp. 3MP-14]
MTEEVARRAPGASGSRAPAHRVVAARLLRELPPAALREVAGVTDWAGPVDLPLVDERTVQAGCGIAHVHGRAAGAPRPLAVEYAATVAGVLTAQGVCAALLARRRGLALRRVTTSVAQAALLSLTQYLAAATAPDGRAEEHPPGSATLVSADGVPVEIETLAPDAWRAFWRRLGVPAALAGRGWAPFQRRFATGVCPLPEPLRSAARAVPLAGLAEAAALAGLSLVALADDPDPAGLPAPLRLRRAPAHGAAPLPPAGGPLPLAGLRVVEATNRVQGPLAGHVLRLLGAEVLRIEPPGGDPMRGLPPLSGDCSARFAALNAGKSAVEADLSTEAGRRTATELAAGADVFLHNWPPGRAERLGLDAPDLWRARPELVYAAASGFGDAFGHDSPPIGTDYLAQAHAGLAAALRPADEPPTPSLMTLTDVLGGVLSAHGVVAALLRRATTGRGARVDSSLLSAAALVPRPAGRAVWTPLDLPLRTADGWLALPARAAADRLPELARISGALTHSAGTVAARFAARPSEAWRAALAEAGIPAVPVATDLAALPGHPAFHAALAPAPPGGHARPRTPWTFS